MSHTKDGSQLHFYPPAVLYDSEKLLVVRCQKNPDAGSRFCIGISRTEPRHGCKNPLKGQMALLRTVAVMGLDESLGPFVIYSCNFGNVDV